MTEKSDLWDIEAEAVVTFKRVYFKGDEITKEEAIQRFKEGKFGTYEVLEEVAVLKVRDAEGY